MENKGTINSIVKIFADIANAIREKSGGVERLQPIQFANEISKLTSVYYLGPGTSFDIRSKFPNDYQRLTADNFFVIINNVWNSGSGFFNWDEDASVLSGTTTINKNYNPSTGILNIGGTSYSAGIDRRGIGTRGSVGIYCNVAVILVLGNIKAA